jgi:hypothetical protein
MILSLLKEAVFLWIAVTIVVFFASVIHYIVASSNLRDLQRCVRDQESQPQPRDVPD